MFPNGLAMITKYRKEKNKMRVCMPIKENDGPCETRYFNSSQTFLRTILLRKILFLPILFYHHWNLLKTSIFECLYSVIHKNIDCNSIKDFLILPSNVLYNNRLYFLLFRIETFAIFLPLLKSMLCVEDKCFANITFCY